MASPGKEIGIPNFLAGRRAVALLQIADDGNKQGFLVLPGQVDEFFGHGMGRFPLQLIDRAVIQNDGVDLGVLTNGRGHFLIEGEIENVAQIGGVHGGDDPGPGTALNELDDFRGQRRQMETGLLTGIGHHHGFAPGAGQHHQPVAFERWLLQGNGRVQNSLRLCTGQDTGLAAGRTHHFVVHGQRGGVTPGDISA